MWCGAKTPQKHRTRGFHFIQWEKFSMEMRENAQKDVPRREQQVEPSPASSGELAVPQLTSASPLSGDANLPESNVARPVGSNNKKRTADEMSESIDRKVTGKVRKTQEVLLEGAMPPQYPSHRTAYALPFLTEPTLVPCLGCRFALRFARAAPAEGPEPPRRQPRKPCLLGKAEWRRCSHRWAAGAHAGGR